MRLALAVRTPASGRWLHLRTVLVPAARRWLTSDLDRRNDELFFQQAVPFDALLRAAGTTKRQTKGHGTHSQKANACGRQRDPQAVAVEDLHTLRRRRLGWLRALAVQTPKDGAGRGDSQAACARRNA